MLRLSPSSVARWYEDGCPARWDFERQYRLVEEAEHLTIGELAHAMLEGEVDPAHAKKDDRIQWTAKMLFEKLSGLRSLLRFNVLHKEIAETFTLRLSSRKKIEWSRRIDAIALDEQGNLVVIDYKTTQGNGWKVLPRTHTPIAPKSLGLQSMGYLIPGDRRLADLGIGSAQHWPKSLYYLVAPYRGQAQAFRFNFSEEAQENFLNLVRLCAAAVEACEETEFPKNYSHHCPACPMMPVCFETSGWEGLLRPREARGENVDET